MSRVGDWTIRRAVVEDAEAIGRFHHQCWTDAYAGLLDPEVLARAADAAARWRRRLGDRRRRTAVAETTGSQPTIVGLACWGPSHDPEEPGLPPLELASLYVDRPRWGSGLAEALLEHALRGRPAHLWVYAGNGRARAFYEKHGFAADGHAKVDTATGAAECRYVRR